MTIVPYVQDDVTKWMHWIARGIGLLAGAIALLVIGSVAGEWFLKIVLSVCQPVIERGDPSRLTLCHQTVAAMGGWVDEIAAAPWPLEATLLAGLLILTLLGVLMAWIREGMGGALLVVGALLVGAFSYVTAEQGKVWNTLCVGGPFLVAGILFLACWGRSRGRRT